MAFVPAETKVYVGNLGTGAGKGELERAFSYYGPLRTVWIARNPPGFAFVEFEDPRDAEDAVRGLDGKVICGSRVRVEVSTGMPRRSRYDRPPARRPFDPNDRCYECGEKGHYAYDCHRYSRRRRSRYVWGQSGWVVSPVRFCVALVSKEQNVTPVFFKL
ncbi:PREDICTED: serine/arginine-rich splicing factor 7 isoform X1 [Cariama cristata]|uniref:serine/arginine-rich splicing factor 7 isoform X1 n=1 Tax=Cariama cristata TaxID=54380 RepID=UPI0005203501|nr:PREDICTED: serine/arginine-rich splicing factor 7 isoform X1 [Cariama cristata]